MTRTYSSFSRAAASAPWTARNSSREETMGGTSVESPISFRRWLYMWAARAL